MIQNDIEQLSAELRSRPAEVRLECRILLEEFESEATVKRPAKQRTPALVDLYILASRAATIVGESAEAAQFAQRALTEAEFLQDRERVARALLRLLAINKRSKDSDGQNTYIETLVGLRGPELSAELHIRIRAAQIRTELDLIQSISKSGVPADGRLNKLSTRLQTLLRNLPNDLPPSMYADLKTLQVRLRIRQRRLQEALEINAECLEVYRSENDIFRLADCLLNNAKIHAKAGKYSNSRLDAQAALELFVQLGNRQRQSLTYTALGQCELQDGNPDKALEYFQKTRELLEARKSFINLATCHKNIAAAHNAAGRYGKALSAGFRALSLFNRYSASERRKRKTLYQLALAYLFLDDKAQALKYFIECASILESQLREMTPEAKNDTTERNDDESQEQFQEQFQADDTQVEQSNTELKTLLKLYGTIGQLSLNIGDLSQAENYLERALNGATELNSMRLRRESLFNLADLALHNRQNGEAIELLNTALAIKVKGLSAVQTAQIARRLAVLQHQNSEFEESQKLFKRALRSLKKAGDLAESVTTLRIMGETLAESDPTAAIKQLNKALKTAENNQLEIVLPEVYRALATIHTGRNEVRKAFRYQSAYLASLERRSSEQEQRRRRTLAILHSVDAERHAFDLEQVQQQYKADDLRKREQELTSKALYLSQRSDLLETLRSQLEQALQVEPGDMRTNILASLRAVDDSMNDNDEWLHFDRSLEKIHQEFRQAISQAFPGLTAPELRVCSLIRLECSTKDIARIMNVSARSADMLRYHIRRKLGLGAGDNLEAFLAGF